MFFPAIFFAIRKRDLLGPFVGWNLRLRAGITKRSSSIMVDDLWIIDLITENNVVRIFGDKNGTAFPFSTTTVHLSSGDSGSVRST